MVSTIGLQPSYINIYDSKYSSLSSVAKNQVCTLLFTDEKVISVQFIDVDNQENTSDGGPYVIAYATSLCELVIMFLR